MDAVTQIPAPQNEPVLQYAPGSAERAELEGALSRAGQAEPVELTVTIGGEQRLGGGERIDVVQPHKHRHVLGTFRNATQQDARTRSPRPRPRPAWHALSYDDRAAILLRAADLLAGPWRATLNAATMLGQSKTAIQAEIDAACELIDFWRFNVAFGRQRAGRAAGSARRACGTGWTTGRWKASSTRSRRSTSPRSPATCRPRRR